MTGKTKKANHRKPDLTVEAGPLSVFMDEPRGDHVTTSPGVVASYDPAVVAFGERMKRDEKHLKSLAKVLEDCLRTAETIKNKRGTELVKLLRDARRKVELIDLK